MMNYKEALDKLEKHTRFGINLGMQRINSLLGIFDNPEEQMPVIHIGGTNGKGSTLAMIASILKEAGYKVGAYTSPHLISYRERFAINGEYISEEMFAHLLEEIFGALEKVQQETGEYPTEFEILTALAFLYFAREKVDILLLEVGMGGDMDSTNVVKNPLLSLITNVSIEHTKYLGNTLPEIAQRKSGIIKKGCPVITACNEEETLKVIREKAKDLQAQLIEVNRQASWEIKGDLSEGKIFKGQAFEGQIISVRTPHNIYEDVFLPLLGHHQAVNAVCAIMAVETLKELGWIINHSTIVKGLAVAKWSGRLEIVSTKPLVVLDGAHNPAGLEALSKWLKRKRQQVGRVILVIGMLDDKDTSLVSEFLEPLIDMVIVTRPNSNRAKNWIGLQDRFSSKRIRLEVIEDLAEALKRAMNEARPNDMILITGSLYLIGSVKELFQ
ncbi:MAG: bifunctional folylpolyglutamate synthase/dihydrofolate synthase [Clostridia bacterium]|nr:bifunctional folylpolyglutamate synthase/dihydrofolate synthase [Clostridia bacterium]